MNDNHSQHHLTQLPKTKSYINHPKCWWQSHWINSRLIISHSPRRGRCTRRHVRSPVSMDLNTFSALSCPQPPVLPRKLRTDKRNKSSPVSAARRSGERKEEWLSAFAGYWNARSRIPSRSRPRRYRWTIAICHRPFRAVSVRRARARWWKEEKTVNTVARSSEAYIIDHLHFHPWKIDGTMPRRPKRVSFVGPTIFYSNAFVACAYPSCSLISVDRQDGQSNRLSRRIRIKIATRRVVDAVKRVV